MAQDLMVLRQQDLVSNPTTRLPICLCLDTSRSMKGNPILELKKGIDFFFQAIKDDEIAKYSIEISIIVFGNKVEKILDFKNMDAQEMPKLIAKGGTLMGEGISLALDILEQRKKEYSNKGIDYYQPWIVLMTDGRSGDNLNDSIRKVTNLANKAKLTLFPIAIGSKADTKSLKELSTLKNNMILKVKNPKYFQDLFMWLSQSVISVSQSTPGDKTGLPSTPQSIEIEL
jgi:uncharacterized protein YegL